MSEESRKGQLDLGIVRQPEVDRNYHLGGRSFYFFDFDDNIAFLATPLILFHKDTNKEIKISSSEFAKHHSDIGLRGIYSEYKINLSDELGTFRNFRDLYFSEAEHLLGKRQLFVEDIAEALGFPDFHWKGPSWECFFHATFNQRPLSVITARGHHPDTIKEGINMFVKNKILPLTPNYLSVYPVSHRQTRIELGDHELNFGTAQLKQNAIRASVEKAIKVCGYNPHHRFGMSDDDPKNIELITEEMIRLKGKYPEMSFFIIETQQGRFIKHEVMNKGIKSKKVANLSQLTFFDDGQK